jgi:hypothetical protein
MAVNPLSHEVDPELAPAIDPDEELGFDPESPDVSDPQVDPLHPARTSNDPVPDDDSQ